MVTAVNISVTVVASFYVLGEWGMKTFIIAVCLSLGLVGTVQAAVHPAPAPEIAIGIPAIVVVSGVMLAAMFLRRRRKAP